MAIVLNSTEARVLGALVEKDITTPDYYPLSLNALVNACNQKNNRDPVMNLDENAVRDALSGLQDLAWRARPAEPIAASPSTSTVCRRSSIFRAARLRCCACCCCAGRRRQANCADVPSACITSKTWMRCNRVCRSLMQREPPLAVMLPRQPGTKESRYAHLLSGEIDVAQMPAPHAVSPSSSSGDD